MLHQIPPFLRVYTGWEGLAAIIKGCPRVRRVQCAQLDTVRMVVTTRLDFECVDFLVQNPET
jgi:hypothetical protein